MIGKTLAHYEITELLGKGGMGEVYRARDTKLEREVAIKVLPREMSGDPERIARFRREARTLATLQHANVASVYGFEDMPEARFLVMELVEGEDLESRLQRGRVPVDEALEIAGQIASGLEAAHEQNIVHRDLKPANIKLTPDGQVKILDFGLARAYHGEAEDGADPTNSPTITAAMTQAGMVLGTAAYMSPEQARGKRVDKRADIWAFGVILYEMLSGTSLFAGDTVSDTLAGVLKTEIDLTELPGDCPPHSVRVLKRCLDRNPSTRLRDIGEARVRLGQPHEVESALGTAASSSASVKRGPMIAVGLLVGLVLGAVLMRMLAPAAQAPASGDEVRFSIPRGETNVPRSSISPDGSRLLFVSDDRLWLRVFEEKEAREVLGSEGALVSTWSPDGQWIAYSTITELYKSRPDGSNRTRLCQVSSDMHPWAGAMAWMEDGRILFVPGDAGINSVSSSGGDPVVIVAPREGETDFHHVAVLPEDRGLIFHPHVDMAFDSIELFAGGERRQLLRMEGQQLNGAQYAAGHLLFGRRPDNPGIWAIPFSLETLEITGEAFLVEEGASFPSASRSGNVAFASDDNSLQQMVRLDAFGNVTGEIGTPIEGARDLSVSPDGTEAALVIDKKDASLWVINLETGERQRLTFQEEPTSNPSWSDTGDQIIYTAGTSTSSLHQKILERDGTATRAVSVRGHEPELTKDGRYLVLSVWNEANEPSLGYVDLEDPAAEAIMIADTFFSEEAPALSPDDRFIVYESLESGRREIYVQSFPEPNSKWQVSQEGGYDPFWSPSGDQIFFGSASGGWMLVVDVSTDPLRFSAPRRAFRRTGFRAFSPLPDGGFLALRRTDAGQAGSYDVWLNWAASLESED